MQKKNYKVLFISHDATRTGAPIVFLHQTKWLIEKADFQAQYLLLGKGPLLNTFESIAKTWIWNQDEIKRAPSKSFLAKLFGRLRKRNKGVLKELDKENYDLIYSNTVASHHVAVALKKRWNIPWITHIHEMPFSIKAFYKDAMNPSMLSEASRIVMASRTCAEMVKAEFDLDEKKIYVVYECVPVNQFANPKKSREEVLTLWNAHERFLVGGSGVMSWRKGIDLFIQLSRKVAELNPNSKALFVWVGNINREVVEGYFYECALLKQTPNIVFTGGSDDPASYFNAFHVFSLTSREDPFPLVVLENAAMGNPIICFEQSGGIPEFIKERGGAIVPYLNIDAMARQIVFWEQYPSEAESIGMSAKREVEKFDSDVIAPRILEIINDVLSAEEEMK
jgi:glycosyltransferase involved in cell wall biosynthesis